jgi:hypothetical protein
MKLILLITIAAFAFACHTKEKEPEFTHVIKASHLIKIVEEGQLKDFTQLLEITGFHVKDTNHRGSGNNSSVRYNCEDSSGLNSMIAFVEKDLRVSNLNLYTEDKRLFDKISTDLEKEGFYYDNDLSDYKLIKKGSPVQIREFIEEGGPQLRYQLIIGRQ